MKLGPFSSTVSWGSVILLRLKVALIVLSPLVSPIADQGSREFRAATVRTQVCGQGVASHK